MINEKTIAVVVKTYNEEEQIGMVMDNMPEFVDRIVIVNDGSRDNTAEVVKEYIEREKQKHGFVYSPVTIPDNSREIITETLYNRADIVLQQMREEERKLYPESEIFNDNDIDRIVLINEVNSGAGGAVVTGYKWARDHKIDCTVVIDGDGQMDPAEMIDIVSPIVYEGIDYVKGNRLSHPAAKRIIPSIRFKGNSVLSLLTKIASGYWSVSDTQTGYTAISINALEKIALHKIFYYYGYPNDVLVKLNIANCTIREVPIKPVYEVGEKSKMKIFKVIPKISGLLFRDFFKRLHEKYFVNSFHPLFLLYWSSFVMGTINVPVFIKIFIDVIVKNGSTDIGFYITFILLTLFSTQSFCFAMWMDMQDNSKLEK